MAKIDINLTIGPPDTSPEGIAKLHEFLKKHYKKEISCMGRCEVCKENFDTDIPGGDLRGNTGALAGLLRQAKRILT